MGKSAIVFVLACAGCGGSRSDLAEPAATGGSVDVAAVIEPASGGQDAATTEGEAGMPAGGTSTTMKVSSTTAAD